MRDFYAEFVRKCVPDGVRQELSLLPKGQEIVANETFGSNASSFESEQKQQNAEMLAAEISQESSSEGPNWIHEYNAIDAYYAKLVRVRNNRELAELLDNLCAERKAIMVGNGSTEEEASMYVSSVEFMAWALTNV